MSSNQSALIGTANNFSTFIDLAREDTIAGVNKLHLAGILAEGRAEQILTNPITPEEEYIG